LVVVLVLPFPVSGRHWNAVFDLAHAPAFALTVVASALLLRSPRHPSADPAPADPRSRQRLVLPAAFVWLLGLLAEFEQAKFGRQPSLGDALANTAGAIAGALLASLLVLPGRKLPRLRGMAAVVLIVLPSIAPGREFLECFRQRAEFPLIASFERDQELSAWRPHESRLKRTLDWSQHGAASLEIIADPDARWPGATLIWPIRDWSAWTDLSMVFSNPGSASLTASLNIADEQHAHSAWSPEDRFRYSITVPPGDSVKAVVPLAGIAAAPARRQLDLTQVAMLDIYVSEGTTGAALRVDDIRLR
jgi:hypothetical protein